MCGIAGIYAPLSDEELSNTALRMSRALAHRGPDDEGVWVDTSAHLALSHRRLSIIDLSAEGHQPMLSTSQRYIIVFNGEIYNYRTLRSILVGRGYNFRGSSDTEVMLAAFEHWGVKEAIPRLNGMFAFALWDRQTRTLTLCRDRLGKKPLYYGWNKNNFFFGSELKALRAAAQGSLEINRDAVALLLQYSYVPSPHSIYRGIFKLPQASSITLTATDLEDRPATFSEYSWGTGLHPSAYWCFKNEVQKGKAAPFLGDEKEALQRFEELLSSAVSDRMVADVPLGAFLSGGIDSSAIVALMQKQSSSPVKTFCIGFREQRYDEAEYAKKVAQHLGTEHTELYLSAEDALQIVPLLPKMFDEPFSDPSQIPTYLVSKLARGQVTVSLSGDGGDELFAGYMRYQQCAAIWKRIAYLPPALRACLGSTLSVIPPLFWETGFLLLDPLLPKIAKSMNRGYKLQKVFEYLDSDNLPDFYQLLVSHWEPAREVVQDSHFAATLFSEHACHPQGVSSLEWMMFIDLLTYFQDDILVKLDRASMAVSLETRVPFSDHRLIEFVCSLPLALRFRQGETKWLLRKLLYQFVPKELVDRPKQGFGIPIESWLRGPLREWAENLLDEQRLRSEGFLNPGTVRKKWQEHLSGRYSWHYHLWDVLMFQAWLQAEKGV